MTGMIYALCMTLCFPVNAYALGQEGCAQLYSVIRFVSIYVSVVGLTICGIMFLTGNDRRMQQARTSALAILASLVMILSLPLLAAFGRDIVSGYEWRP